jgi:hypothetical protein
MKKEKRRREGWGVNATLRVSSKHPAKLKVKKLKVKP